MVSCIDLVEECVVGVEGARTNQVVAHLDNTNKDDKDKEENQTVSVVVSMPATEGSVSKPIWISVPA